jgi:hypothetical protein
MGETAIAPSGGREAVIPLLEDDYGGAFLPVE